ncbi:hypothetical protein V6N12_059221 [Hibiscus sabdariffa]|uniref:Reverse transcriptase zinc-binding domain-containing protein n=1 Tax=Hibiscus sabdariffa TaxID=183260 RepID=A0ABR2EXP8_9ROSI
MHHLGFKDIVRHDGQCDFDQLGSLFPGAIVAHIACILPTSLGVGCDHIVWSGTSSGAFSVSSSHGFWQRKVDERLRQGCISDSSCLNCGCCREAVLHILRDCPLLNCYGSNLSLERITKLSLIFHLSVGSLKTFALMVPLVLLNYRGHVFSRLFFDRSGSGGMILCLSTHACLCPMRIVKRCLDLSFCKLQSIGPGTPWFAYGCRELGTSSGRLLHS